MGKQGCIGQEKTNPRYGLYRRALLQSLEYSKPNLILEEGDRIVLRKKGGAMGGNHASKHLKKSSIAFTGPVSSKWVTFYFGILG